ncbi:MAG: hypothetical protein IT355_18685 [Gemmatimonadaceae bacterium]|nr:hypothetical protein [Gemmatimonadaceae bacterium]
MARPIVFFDIAGPADTGLREFYASLFEWTADAGGRIAVPAAATLSGAFRADPAEKRLYIGVDDVTATLNAIVAAGGKVHVPRFEVPGVVVLGLFADPAGNPMGLVEMDGDAPKIP